MKMLTLCAFTYILIIVRDNTANYISYTDTCPIRKKDWIERSQIKRCTGKGRVYHCLATNSGLLVEICIRRLLILRPKGTINT